MESDICKLTHHDVVELVKWADAEGWNPGLHDAASFWELDPDGFLGIFAQGNLAGAGAIIRHNEYFGFMGLFIVRPEFRGKGLGTRLWYTRRDHLLSRLHEGGTIAMDGVDAMVPFYERGGFRQFTRHRRFQLSPVPGGNDTSGCLMDMKQIAPGDITTLDQDCFPGDRSQFLQHWIRQPGTIALASVTPSIVDGFAVMRPCSVGWKIGPLIAKDFNTANELFKALCRHAEGQPVFLDVPDNNPHAVRLCAEHNMEEVFGCMRMYLGPPPKLNDARIFGVATLEVG